MSITTTASIRYTLMSVFVDADSGFGVVRFQRWIDGKRDGEVEARAEGNDLVAMMAVVPEGSKTRGDDLTAAIFDFAVSRGILPGSI